MDIFDKCLAYTRPDELKAADLYPYFTPIGEAVGNRIKVGGRPMIMVGSNNYLGLAHHPGPRKRPGRPSSATASAPAGPVS